MRRRFHTLAIALSLGAVVSIGSASQQASLREAYQRPDNIPFPAENPYSAEKALLGKMLFFDQRLSRNFNMSCGTCHNPSLGWEDGVPGAFGGKGQFLSRHSQTVLNLAWSKHFFWDGRAGSLEQQSGGPIASPDEMDLPLSEAVKRLNAVPGYRQRFSQVFTDGVTAENIAAALATFQRTLVSGVAPFDDWVNGDEGAISEDAKIGFRLFNSKARCSACHGGWNFSDDDFHDIGLVTEDIGREKVTGQNKDRHRFKTPGLRSIAQRAPYMHNGSIRTLDEVIDHYMGGGMPRETRSEKMQPVPLNMQERKQLIAFLNSLTGEDKPVSLPILPY